MGDPILNQFPKKATKKDWPLIVGSVPEPSLKEIFRNAQIYPHLCGKFHNLAIRISSRIVKDGGKVRLSLEISGLLLSFQKYRFAII
jgi:hypothetical protein